jgi:ABC-type transport system substrate-binding protein
MVAGVYRKGIALTVFFLLLILFVLPAPALAQPPPGGPKSGPYIDRIRYDVILDPEDQWGALVHDEIDLIGNPMDLEVLMSIAIFDEALELSSILANGYEYVCINCAKYPYNITSFRRALGFALDKAGICDIIMYGLSTPLDACVPTANDFSIEGQLPYSYHNKSLLEGNSLLDSAGFEDVDYDGFRDAPDGSNFSVCVQADNSSRIDVATGQFVVNALLDLQIDAALAASSDLDYILQNGHIRLFDYDMYIYRRAFDDYEVDWLAYEFWSENADDPYFNHPSFRNETYDSWRDLLLNTTDMMACMLVAHELQKIIAYECPIIPVFDDSLFYMYRTDKFEGHINDIIAGVPGWWTNYKIHLRADKGGPWGGTFRCSIPHDLNSFNFMVTSDPYDMNIFEMLYDSLLKLDANGVDILWLAESFLAETHADNDAVSEGYTRFTFNLIQNATWTDGTPLTAEDVAYTMNYYRDAPGNPYGHDLTNMTVAYAETTYTLIVEFNSESYWHLHNIAYKPIIPKHVFEEVGINDWHLWNPQPPGEKMVTSGPFNISEYIEGEFIELTFNPEYFYTWSPCAPNYTTSTSIPDFEPFSPLEWLINTLRSMSPLGWGIITCSLIVIFTVFFIGRLEIRERGF